MTPAPPRPAVNVPYGPSGRRPKRRGNRVSDAPKGDFVLHVDDFSDASGPISPVVTVGGGDSAPPPIPERGGFVFESRRYLGT